MRDLFTYKLIISYDGGRYCGWQMQPNGSSIQEAIENVLHQVINRSCSLVGSGRTDAGVHALGQTAHFRTKHKIDCYKLQRSLNALLPDDIRIRSVLLTPNTFHARYSALAKHYRYFIKTGPIVSPFDWRYYHHIKREINFTLLKEASRYFIGTYNFSSFANEANQGSAAKNAVRTIYSLEVQKFEDKITLDFYGNGFLYKMVRNIVGTLIAVSLQQLPLTRVPWLIAAQDRRQAPSSAPAQGLFLISVKYKRIYEKIT